MLSKVKDTIKTQDYTGIPSSMLRFIQIKSFCAQQQYHSVLLHDSDLNGNQNKKNNIDT